MGTGGDESSWAILAARELGAGPVTYDKIMSCADGIMARLVCLVGVGGVCVSTRAWLRQAVS